MPGPAPKPELKARASQTTLHALPVTFFFHFERCTSPAQPDQNHPSLRPKRLFFLPTNLQTFPPRPVPDPLRWPRHVCRPKVARSVPARPRRGEATPDLLRIGREKSPYSPISLIHLHPPTTPRYRFGSRMRCIVCIEQGGSTGSSSPAWRRICATLGSVGACENLDE